MASRELTREEALLLQRHYDGELSAAESVEAKQLLERSKPARVFVRALEELTGAVVAADKEVWERVEDRAPSSKVVGELAENAGDLTRAPIEDLAPLLDRFHDGEADQAEIAFVSALLDEREDAADYLAQLGEVRRGLQAAEEALCEGVDFDGMWRGIEEALGEPEQSEAIAFDRDEHLTLLCRYKDGEVDAQEALLIERWIEQEDAQVEAFLEALDEISLGVSLAVDTACERTSLDAVWSGVSQAIGDEERDSGSVVSMKEARNDRRESARSADSPTRRGAWWNRYRQAIVGAAAAAVVLAGLAGLFKDAIFGPTERVVVEERVVVVDHVEYAPGSSVMIDSPARQAGMNDEAQDEVVAAEEEDPTVIWLLDEDDEEVGGEQQAPPAPGHQPAEPSGDAGTDDDGDDRPDAGSMPRGQPI